ncbi:hypothetical protein J8M97_14380 [Gordonia polyisoprenivorans]|uniref:hypothetical protein n=1 Tax=Gordonia polyisoprenivorans TaxID=84595 RepID=UPI000B99E0A0|nr:hypothetical protein [Gordonia polyisoprenivorans]OZC29931.1 hypothetical protein CJJ17_25090 [Gordonia polyisoprenivorans]QUD81036.1 hypothetical protein J8M97_14380 [Gordonia polyisoprenivorans]
MTAAQQVAATGQRTVIVRPGIRCVAEGHVYTGETATVPAALADEWIRAQWADPAPETPAPAAAPAPAAPVPSAPAPAPAQPTQAPKG